MSYAAYCPTCQKTQLGVEGNKCAECGSSFEAKKEHKQKSWLYGGPK